jgi:hypothetical protein
MKHSTTLIFTAVWLLSEDTGSSESVGTSTPLFPPLKGNINVHLLNNICLPVHKEIHSSEITVNQGVTGTCISIFTRIQAVGMQVMQTI